MDAAAVQNLDTNEFVRRDAWLAYPTVSRHGRALGQLEFTLHAIAEDVQQRQSPGGIVVEIIRHQGLVHVLAEVRKGMGIFIIRVTESL